MQEDKLIIRSACYQDSEFGLNLAKSQGWNPGLYDGEIIAMADPWGCFAAIIDGQTVGFISALRFNDDYGFAGGLIVDPAFQGRGIAEALGAACNEHLTCRTIGCDSIIPLIDAYAKRGYVAAYRNRRYMITAQDFGAPATEVVELQTSPLTDIFIYDRSHFPAPREHFLLRWCFQPDAISLAYVENRQLKGYGVLRKSLQGRKIGPLFADTPAIAEELFRALVSRTVGEAVFLDIPAVNSAAVAMTERYGMTPVFETCRMYMGDTPDLPLEHIFSITSNEIG